jgi:hypothetical protein
VAFVVARGVSLPPHNEASSLPAAGLLLTAASVMATCRILVDPAGFIDVISPVTSRRVRVSEVVAIEHGGGLGLVSGQRIGRVACGSSLVGHALPSARSAKAVRRIERAIGVVPTHAELPDWRQDSVVWKPRRAPS